MKFIATPEQVAQIAANAVNASTPMGLGALHYNQQRQFVAGDFEPDARGLYLDYVEGRMVKLYIRKDETLGNSWELAHEPRADYQSWAHKYPTNEALVASVILQ